jgi:bifunctional pyridoxal-dependent enzyme with beta-cystathionase and maltose regulon repressor activities
VAAFLTSNFKARQKVTMNQIIVMTGLKSIIEALAWSICNEGEGLLIPVPNYSGFAIDLPPRSRALLVPATFRDLEGYTSLNDVFEPKFIIAALEKALEKSRKNKVVIKGVLLSRYGHSNDCFLPALTFPKRLVSPHNPLGRCYVSHQTPCLGYARI